MEMEIGAVLLSCSRMSFSQQLRLANMGQKDAPLCPATKPSQNLNNQRTSSSKNQDPVNVAPRSIKNKNDQHFSFSSHLRSVKFEC